MHLTCSAVSKSVAWLEARLGSRPLERTTRSLVLTDAGQAFYDTCPRVLNELAAQRTIPVGRLRLTVPHTFGRLHATPLLNAFCQQYPEMQLNLSFSDHFVDLFEEGVDVAIRLGGPGNYPPALSARYLGSERLIFCASPVYLAQHGTPQSLAELEQHRAIVYSRGDGSASPWLMREPLETGELVPFLPELRVPGLPL